MPGGRADRSCAEGLNLIPWYLWDHRPPLSSRQLAHFDVSIDMTPCPLHRTGRSKIGASARERGAGDGCNGMITHAQITLGNLRAARNVRFRASRYRGKAGKLFRDHRYLSFVLNFLPGYAYI